MAQPSSVPAGDLVVWSLQAQVALQEAMRRHNCLSQRVLADRLASLASQAGVVVTVSQQQVSSWLRETRTPQGRPLTMSDARAGAIAEYLAEVGIRSLTQWEPWPLSVGSREDEDGVEGGPEPAVPPDSAVFVAQGEPELGGRRARLVDTVLERLATVTGHVTDNELALIAWVSEVERITPTLRLLPSATTTIDVVAE